MCSDFNYKLVPSEDMKRGGHRGRTLTIYIFFVLCGISGFIGLFTLAFRPVDRRGPYGIQNEIGLTASGARRNATSAYLSKPLGSIHEGSKSCATVEEMGEVSVGDFRNESLRVRRIIHNHFDIYGAPSIRDLPPEQFCKHGFVIGKASEAGFGNEMYKILTAAALSIMLNRSLIIGQIRGQYQFGNFISYSNMSFTLKEVKQLWRKNECVRKYRRNLIVRVDNFEKPTMTNVLCGNWKEWEHPIIWLQGTIDAMAVQFFLKNIHVEMRRAASELFGKSGLLHLRPNIFGELMRFLIRPSYSVEEAVNWVLQSQTDPHIALHMRMRMNRSVRAIRAALNCVKKAVPKLQVQKPRVVLVSDTPSLVRSIIPLLKEFAEVLHFDYELYKGNISNYTLRSRLQDFRVRDWGPAPRWVAFVDFFLASRAKHAFISGAHRRVGTTYAQLIAALAAAQNLGTNGSLKGNQFSFLSSFQGSLVSDGLRDQVGWGHVWNRFAGPLSCPSQPDQCALTPLLPPAWWDGVWQSPLPHDIRRLETYGIRLSESGTFTEQGLQDYCNSKKHVVTTMPIAQM